MDAGYRVQRSANLAGKVEKVTIDDASAFFAHWRSMATTCRSNGIFTTSICNNNEGITDVCDAAL
ncbi:hypothetical protein [Methylocapsa sp. S129]|uniref:hypothetical protein n=1 Tax=Methylocapsa sp. S129 TaxID=1641869 RepID=UPI00131A7F45|nr:hypothetical protein [Methylocapsa sp. S129]